MSRVAEFNCCCCCSVYFRCTKLRWIRKKQEGKKTIESSGNGIPKALKEDLACGREAFIAFCASCTDENKQKLTGKEAALAGKVLLVVRVLFVFSRNDSKGDCCHAQVMRDLLNANPSSNTRKPDGSFRYNHFMALDLSRMKVIDDPGISIPASVPCKRVAVWFYDGITIKHWIRHQLGGLP